MLLICGWPNVIWGEAWAFGILPKQRNYCGKRSENRTPPPRSCYPISICEETVFREAAIKPGSCWWLQPRGAPLWRLNSCAIWNRRVATKEFEKLKKKPKDPRTARVFLVSNRFDSTLKMTTTWTRLMEIENILLPALQRFRRAPGLPVGGLRTRGPVRPGSRARACHR